MRQNQNQSPKKYWIPSQSQRQSQKMWVKQNQKERVKQKRNPKENQNPNRKLKRCQNLSQILTFVFRLAIVARMAGAIKTDTLHGANLNGKHRAVLPSSARLFPT